ncbi:MAG: type II secretion system F family protein [Bacillota bacterium]|nr:type II secretion system F family protein [Bacillota bacterium]
MPLPDVAAVAALLAGGAVLLPSLSKIAPANRVQVSEVFCRTGVRFSSPEERGRLSRKLAQAGVREKPEWFLGLRLSLVGGFLVLFIPLLLAGTDIFWPVLLAPLLYLAPNIWLSGRVSKRKSEIRLALADFTLFLSTALSAGSDIRLALREAAEGVGGALREEVKRALLESGTGKRLADALDEMADRCDVDELRTLARVLNQALRYGSSLADVMQAYSEQMRTVRRFEIMEAANKLSVKLVVPVLLFILGPCMLALGYPAIVGLLKALK